MLTPAKLNRLWQQSRHRALVREVAANRPEARLELDARLGGPTLAAALGLMRLGELNQLHQPLARSMRDRLAWSQAGDGSWGERGGGCPVLTAFAARALSATAATTITNGRTRLGMAGAGADAPASHRANPAAARGVAFLAAVQRDAGGWSGRETATGEPLDDAYATGVILLQLGRDGGFRQSVRLEDALSVEPVGEREADAVTRMAWRHARLRLGNPPRPARRRPVAQPTLPDLLAA